MSTTHTANIVVGLYAEDLEDWALENEEILEDLFSYFHLEGVFGYAFMSTEDLTVLSPNSEATLKTLIEAFKEITGLDPKVFLLVDSY